MNHLPVLIPVPLLFAAFIVPLAGLLHKGLVPVVALLGAGISAATAAERLTSANWGVTCWRL